MIRIVVIALTAVLGSGVAQAHSAPPATAPHRAADEHAVSGLLAGPKVPDDDDVANPPFGGAEHRRRQITVPPGVQQELRRFRSLGPNVVSYQRRVWEVLNDSQQEQMRKTLAGIRNRLPARRPPQPTAPMCRRALWDERSVYTRPDVIKVAHAIGGFRVAWPSSPHNSGRAIREPAR